LIVQDIRNAAKLYGSLSIKQVVKYSILPLMVACLPASRIRRQIHIHWSNRGRFDACPDLRTDDRRLKIEKIVYH